MAGRITSACCAVSVMNCSSTTVKRSSRARPSSTRSWSGAIAAGFELQQTSAFTGGSIAGSVSASPSRDMLIVRTGAGRRSSRWSGALLIAAGRGGRDVGAAAAAVPPGAGEQRERGDRGVRGRRAGVALGAHAEPQQRGPGGGELAAHARDRLGVDPALRRALLDGGLAELREQLVVAVGVRPAPLLVVEAGVDDRAHHPDGERGVGARQRAQVLVGEPRRAAAERDPPPRAARPGLRASSSLRHRCGAVDSGFQPQISR